MEINRKRVARRLASGLVAGALAFGGLALSGASPAGALPIDLDTDQRIGGADRYATAANVADTLEDELGTGIELVVVANGENFPDALAASALAGDEGAILLVKSSEIPSAVRDRMNRLSDSVLDVYVVGGETAVSAGVFAELEDIFENADLVRVGGADRYATASAIADEVGIDAGVIALVSGAAYADAVSAGPWAAANGYPILLANSSGIPAATAASIEAAIDEDSDTKIIILGGPSAVSAGAEDALVELGVLPANISRVAGSDRYTTNLLWNLEEFGLAKYTDGARTLLGVNAVFVSGANFPDALAAAPLAAQLSAHIVLVDPATVGAAGLGLASYANLAAGASQTGSAFGNVTAALTDYQGGDALFGDDRLLADVWVIGGTTAVPDSVISTMASIASDTVDCSITIGGANDDNAGQDGPETFIISFEKDLSVNTTGTGGEKDYFADNEDDLFELNGTGIAVAETALDLNGNGFTDAYSVQISTADQVDVGDTIEFVGWAEDDEDYGTTGSGLRNVGPCEAKVTRDRTAPTLTARATDGTSLSYWSFSEPLSDDGTDWTAAVDYMADLSDGTDDTTAGDVTTNAVTCVMLVTNQEWMCDNGDENYVAGDTVDSDIDAGSDRNDFYDVAGNFYTATHSATWVKASGDTDFPAPSISEVTAVCAERKAYSAGPPLVQPISNVWNSLTGGTIAADDDGKINVATDSDADGLTLTAGSGLSKLTANDWTFTFTHTRGLLRPTVSVEGTDVTVTIDRYVHTANDMAKAINVSTVGGGGLSPVWTAAVNTDELIDPLTLDEALDTASSGVEQENSCLITVTLSGPMAPDGVTGDLNAVTSAPSAAGDIAVRIGGAYQTAVWEWATYNNGGDATTGGTTFYGLVNNTTDTGTVRVELSSYFMHDTAETAVKNGSASIS